MTDPSMAKGDHFRDASNMIGDAGNMVERVARAILRNRFFVPEPEMYGHDLDRFFLEIDPEHVEEARSDARVAIEALREPTQAMLHAPEVPFVGPNTCARIWRTMCDAALDRRKGE